MHTWVYKSQKTTDRNRSEMQLTRCESGRLYTNTTLPSMNRRSRECVRHNRSGAVIGSGQTSQIVKQPRLWKRTWNRGKCGWSLGRSCVKFTKRYFCISCPELAARLVFHTSRFCINTAYCTVANPRLASRMRLIARFHAVLSYIPEVPLNNMHDKWLVKFCHCHVGQQ